MQKVLIIGKVWPEPTSSAAGTRILQLISVLSENYSICFACAANKSEFSADLEKFGVTEAIIALNDSSFDQFVKELDPGLVIFDRYTIEEQFSWRVREACPNALRILDTEDMHCLRIAREQALKENRTFTLNELFSDTAKREIASIYRSDLSLIISDYEMVLLQNHFKIPGSLLLYLPIFVDSERIKDSWLPFEEKENFVTIGNFLHPPNLDAVIFTKKEVWPLIRKKLPDAKMLVYGSYANDRVKALHDEKIGFIIKGRADSVKEIMSQGRVCLAPLRFGAGLKGKLLDAMEYGTPSITTPIGAEGIAQQLPWGGYIAENPAELAHDAIELYNNKQEWTISRENGFKILEEKFSKNIYSEKLKNHLSFTLKNSNKIPAHNFIGSMLWHHSMQSSRYLSLYIEMKNKLQNIQAQDPTN